MAGAFKVNGWIAFFAATGVILSAAYGLRLFREVMYGELQKEKLMEISDVSLREGALLAILVLFALYLGVYPSAALNVFAPAVDVILTYYNAAPAALAGAL